jgi:RNA polymerase sigma factor (sigma-70 family)
MATSQMSKVSQHLRRLALHDGATDGELLRSFVQVRDEAALAALVRRHGPMVWGVCRRLLRSHHDAEDAFQATFLVLVRKAATIRDRKKVANWLYGVAHQTAVRMRATAARRRGREHQVADMPEPAAKDADLHDDLRPLLDLELSRLPDKYRVLIVLCDLEGKTRKEAARQLGCPEGTVGGRLARARAMLAKRLSRHGTAVPAAALAAALSMEAASASLPAAVASSTIRAASLVAAGQAASALISAEAVALTDGVIKAMLIQKVRTVTVLVMAAVCVAGGLFTCRAAPGGPEGGAPAVQDTAPPAPARADDKAEPAKKEPAPVKKERVFQIDEIDSKMLRDLGNRFDVEVIGRTDGTVSGTELYFYDSVLDAAAVHAGLVKVGEKAVITVTVVKCPPSSAGSTQNGVKSLAWDGARPGDTALLLKRRSAKDDKKPKDEEPPAKSKDDKGHERTPKALTLDEAVKEKVGETATVEFEVEYATLTWITARKAEECWVVQLIPKKGLKDGSEFQLRLTSSAVTHLRNLRLVDEHSEARDNASFFRGKVIRMTGKVESWPDPKKEGATIYRLCVSDLGHLQIVR